MHRIVLALVLLPALAFADPPAAAPAPVLVLPDEAPPVLTVTTEAPTPAIPADRLALTLKVLDAAIGQVKRDLGVPAITIPASFWETKGGQALAWGLAIGAVGVSGALAGVSVWQAVR